MSDWPPQEPTVTSGTVKHGSEENQSLPAAEWAKVKTVLLDGNIWDQSGPRKKRTIYLLHEAAFLKRKQQDMHQITNAARGST